MSTEGQEQAERDLTAAEVYDEIADWLWGKDDSSTSGDPEIQAVWDFSKNVARQLRGVAENRRWIAPHVASGLLKGSDPGGELRQPDWSDVRAAARAAGLTIQLRRGRRKARTGHHNNSWLWRACNGEGYMVAEFESSAIGRRVDLSGPDGIAQRDDPTPTHILTAARLVGLGGDSDA